MWKSSIKKLLPLLSSSSALLPPSPRPPLPLHLLPIASSSFGLNRFSSEPAGPALPPAGSPQEEALIENYLGIATGVEREELLAELRGKKLFDLDPARGPFGTKEAPAIVESNFDERIVGCCGGEAEDEHDVVWFKLRKGETYECTVCTQVFQLRVIGPGGLPGGHHDHH